MLAAVAFMAAPAPAAAKGSLESLNRELKGKVVDYTANHGRDNRIYSLSLLDKRDLYVYLPPGFNPHKTYPLMIYLHGILQDEKGFLQHVVRPLDKAIVAGKLPPLIVAAPDGCLTGHASVRDPGSFFVNSKAGDFEDYVMRDVWNFLVTHYPIRPEREAHVLCGVSMGGLGAYNMAIRYRHRFKTVIGVLPVLNLRWMNLKGDCMADFDPFDWGWRNSAADPNEIVGQFGGLIKLRMSKLLYPVFGSDRDNVICASRENPIELVDRHRLRNGELDMFVGYAGRDEFNLDAHAESFIYLVKSRGIRITTYCDPFGTHSEQTAEEMIPIVIDWLGARLHCYHEAACAEPVCPQAPVAARSPCCLSKCTLAAASACKLAGAAVPKPKRRFLFDR